MFFTVGGGGFWVWGFFFLGGGFFVCFVLGFVF